jgi:Ulp1 family protease
MVCSLNRFSRCAAFTALKRNEVNELLKSWHVLYTPEKLTVPSQRNAIDCGLYVVLFGHRQMVKLSMKYWIEMSYLILF